MEKFVFYIAVALGVIVHLLSSYRDSITKNLVYEWKKQLIMSGINLVFGFVLVFFRNDIATVTKMTPIATFAPFWFFVGISADSIMKAVLNYGPAILKSAGIQTEVEDKPVEPSAPPTAPTVAP